MLSPLEFKLSVDLSGLTKMGAAVKRSETDAKTSAAQIGKALSDAFDQASRVAKNTGESARKSGTDAGDRYAKGFADGAIRLGDGITRGLPDPNKFRRYGGDAGASYGAGFKTAINGVFTGILQGVGQQLTNFAANAAGSLKNLAFSREALESFDDARAKVSTLTNDMSAMIDVANNVSRSVNYSASSTTVLAASYDVLSAGFSKASDAANVLTASQKGAIGGQSDLNTVSNATTTILNAYELASDKADKVVSQMIGTQNAGKIVVGEYASLIGRVARTASEAGVGLEELNGIIATATVKGVSASSAIDGTRQAIASILKPSKEASEYAASLGVGFDAAALKSKGFVGILQDLKDKNADSVDSLLKLFGSVEAVAAIAPSAGSGLASLTANIATIKGASADDAFDKMSNSIQGMSQRNKVLREELALKYQTATAPLFDGANKALDRLLVSLNEGGALFDGVNGAAKQFSDFLSQNPAIIDNMIAGFNELMSSGLSALQSSIVGITEALAQNPQLIGDFINSISSGIQGTIQFVTEFVGGFVGGMGEVMAVVGPIGEALAKIFGGSIDQSGTLAENLGKNIAIIGSILLGVTTLASVLGTVISVVGAIGGAISAVVSIVAGIPAIIGGISSAIAGITGLVGGVGGAFGAVAAVITGPVGLAIAGVAAAIIAIAAITKNWGNTCGFVRGLINTITSAISATIGRSEVLRTLWNGITTIIKFLLSPLTSLLNSVGVIITKSQTLTNIWEGFKTIVGGVGDAIKNSIGGALDWLMNKAGDVRNAVSSIASSGDSTELQSIGGSVLRQAGGASGDGLERSLAIATASIKKSEEFRANRYLDSEGIATIGYGTTDKSFVARGTVSEPEAAAMLNKQLMRNYLEPALAMLKPEVRQRLSVGQTAAIASFAYNTGVGKEGFQRSSFGKALIRGDMDGARQALPTSYINAGGPSERGLRNRRAHEARLWDGTESVGDVAMPTKYVPSTSGSVSDRIRSVVEPSRGGSTGGQNGSGGTVRVTRTGTKDQYGGEVLQVDLVRNGQVVDSVKAASGSVGNQRFERLGKVTQGQGSMAPLPEGTYGLGAVERTNKAGGWGKGLGGTYIAVTDAKTGSESLSGTRGRSAVGLHEDANRLSGSPGSAGCVVFYDQASTNRVAQWVQGGAKKLEVDYGLGTFGPRQPNQRSTQQRSSSYQGPGAGTTSTASTKPIDNTVTIAADPKEVAISNARALAAKERLEERQRRSEQLSMQRAGASSPDTKSAVEREIAALKIKEEYEERIIKLQQQREDIQRGKGDDATKKTQIASVDALLAKEIKARDVAVATGAATDRATIAEAARADAIAQRASEADRAWSSEKAALELQRSTLADTDPIAAKNVEHLIERKELQQALNKEIQTELDKLAEVERSLAELSKFGLDKSPEATMLRSTRDSMNRQISARRSQQQSQVESLDIKQSREVRGVITARDKGNLERDRFLSQPSMDTARGAASNMRQRGNVEGANRIDKRVKLSELEFEYREKMLAVDEKVADLRSRGVDVSEEQVASIKDSLQAAKEFDMSNVNNQFDTFRNEILPNIQSSVGGFFKELLNGTKSADEAFSDMISNITSQIIDFAVNQMVSSLFGGLMGGVGGAAGGGGGGGFMGIFKKVFGYSKGGLAGTGASLAVSLSAASNPIADALRKEGPNSILAALTPDELVLTVEQTKAFFNSSLKSEIPGFKGGGVVGGAKFGMSSKDSTGDSVNLALNVSGGGGDGLDYKRVAKMARQAASAEIAQQKKPRGLLRGHNG